MILWIAAAVLVALTLAVLVAALVRARPQASARRRDYDVVVYRDQLEEVERDVERGVLAADQAEAARVEIKRRMLAAADGAKDGATEPALPKIAPAWRWAALALIMVLVPVGSVGLYLMIGAPEMPDEPLASRPARHQAAQGHGEMERLTAQLEAQLKEHPDRVEGWMLLGRSLRSIGKYGESAKAFERVVALTKRAPDVLAEYGEVLVLAAGGQVPDQAVDVFNEVVAAAPTEPRARFYLGLSKAQRGDARGALQAWVDLIAMSPADVPWLGEVRSEIQKTASEAGIDVATIKPTPGLPVPPAAQSAPAQAAPSQAQADEGTPGPSAEDMKAADKMTPEERQTVINSMVKRLADRLKDNPDDAAGWRRLAHAYQVLGEADKARDALAKAMAAEKKAKP